MTARPSEGEAHGGALDALLTRRSIRRFSDEPVTDAEVDAVLRAAMAAPSAFNEQSWRFVVVRDARTRVALSEASKHAGPLAAAPVAIVVCGDTTAERYPGTYWTLDCTAALENLLVAANATGLGAVWIGVHPWPDRAAVVRRAVGLPDGVEPLASVALGHPAETRPAASRFEPSFVHRESWDPGRPRGPKAPEPGNTW